MIAEPFALWGLFGRPSPHSGDQRCELLVEADMIHRGVERTTFLDWLDPRFCHSGLVRIHERGSEECFSFFFIPTPSIPVLI